MIRPLLAAALLALNPPPPALVDYQVCAPVRPGPVTRPDRYAAHPYGARKADFA